MKKLTITMHNSFIRAIYGGGRQESTVEMYKKLEIMNIKQFLPYHKYKSRSKQEGVLNTPISTIQLGYKTNSYIR